MRIPTSAIVPFYVVSFLVLAYQYFRVNPERRLVNLRFCLMAGAIVLMLATILLANRSLLVGCFALALVWLALSLYLLRHMPPTGH